MPLDSIRARTSALLGPVPFWMWLALFLLLGALFGLGTYTFTYAQGFSYASDDPKACANCHVMQEVYVAWNAGSHHAVAVCNDCHLPRAILPHYAVKAYDGVNHSVQFTTGNIPDPIRILSFDRGVVEQNCLECHADMVVAISHVDNANPTDCLTCHTGVGHWLAK